LLSEAVGNCSDRRRVHRSAHLTKGGLYGSCPGLRFVPASHLVTPSREAHRPRLATYWALPEARTTSRPSAARRVAVASGDRTVKKATAVMTAQPGRSCRGRSYSDRGGISSYYCPEGNRLLCEECATRGAGVCPHIKSLVHGERRPLRSRAPGSRSVP
jgi:hypothetical protein